MNIPQVPTDSLYKFIAITGLLCVVIGLTVPIISTENFQLEASTLSTQIQDDSAQVSNNDVKVALLTKEVLNEKQPDYQNSQSAFDLYAQSKILANQAGADDALFRDLVSNFELQTKMLFLTAFLGILIAAIGFILWYLKLQRYQDAILRHEAEKFL